MHSHFEGLFAGRRVADLLKDLADTDLVLFRYDRAKSARFYNYVVQPHLRKSRVSCVSPSRANSVRHCSHRWPCESAERHGKAARTLNKGAVFAACHVQYRFVGCL